jgi:hypothetical protein
MALSSQSLILYGYEVGVDNQNLDFRAASGGPTLTAQIPIGDYSLTTLLSEIATALLSADPTSGQAYFATADRTVLGGLENRVTLAASGGLSGTFFSLLFGSGPNASTSIAELIGFAASDRTGALSYTGTITTGTTLIPDFIGYNYADQNQQAKLMGAVNISASGLKESVVFNEQYFIDVEFKYEPKSKLAQWVSFRDWAIQQRPFDFTPEVRSPSVFSPVTFEKTQYDSKGMGFLMKEMLSEELPNFYTTGPITMRVVLDFNATVFMTG